MSDHFDPGFVVEELSKRCQGWKFRASGESVLASNAWTDVVLLGDGSWFHEELRDLGHLPTPTHDDDGDPLDLHTRSVLIALTFLEALRGDAP